jgi:hypothetical protein
VHQIFARIRPRLEGARRELGAIDEALEELRPERLGDATRWARRSAAAFAIATIFTGLESILRVIADDIDRHLPAGADWHAELLLAMSLELPGTRPAVLAPDTRFLLDELRKFRHVVRNNYALDLTDEGVFANLDRARAVLPLFERDLAAFETAMTNEAQDSG